VPASIWLDEDKAVKPSAPGREWRGVTTMAGSTVASQRSSERVSKAWFQWLPALDVVDQLTAGITVATWGAGLATRRF
jgi:hypothetical protein